MSFLSKVELKCELEKMGVKVVGNYIKKKDLSMVLAAKPLRKSIHIDTKEIVFTVYIGGSDIDKATLENLNEALWNCSPRMLEGPWDGTYEITFDVENDSNMSVFVKEKKEQINNALYKVILS